MSLEHKILTTLGRPDYQPVTVDELCRQLNINRKRRPEFDATVESLRNGGRIEVTRDGHLRAKRESGLIRGVVKKIASGAAFLIAHPMPSVSSPRPGTGRGVGGEGRATQDIFITPEDLGEAHTGDEVLVRVLPARESDRRRGPAGRLRGRVVEILERATRTFVGNYFERDGQGWVQVDGTTISDPIFVGDPGAKGAKAGDKVVIEMVRFPSHFRHGEAVLTSVLGPRGRPGVDTLSIIHEFGLPDEFPAEVLAAARDQAEQFDEDELGDRRDLTAETIVTIDPVDARDFDDAISLTQSDDGHWHLGVHIADVAHFVQPGSILDREAYRRGTSVYLPDRVIPMLPEVISNGLASLQQGRVRFTKSAFIEFTREGIPVATEFVNSAIKVTQRFAYEEVMPIIHSVLPSPLGGEGPGVRGPSDSATSKESGATGSSSARAARHRKHATGGRAARGTHSHVAPAVRDLLVRMHELAMILRARRFAVGALELTLPEVKIDLDRDGRVCGAHVAPHDESHEIIEEFMLAANVAIASALADRGIPFLRRVHADPDETKLRAFGEFVTSLGFKLKKFQSRMDLQRLLDLVHERPERHAVNYAFLRSLKQAAYSPEPLGHYALAFENYCHFTSPIRRYPDLMVHRLVDELARHGRVTHAPNESELIGRGLHCSTTERRSEQAERELVKIKLLTYLAGRVGEELDAVITGVQEYGFFCQGIDIPAEGLVHSTTFDDDRYDYDAVSHTISARRGDRRYRLGDKVRVVIAHVDVDRRQLDFRLAGSRSAKQVRDRKAADKARPNREPRSRGRPASRPDRNRRRKRR